MKSLIFILLLLIPATVKAQAVRIDSEYSKKICQNGYCRIVKSTSVGTGVIVSRCEGETYILTAAHVVTGSNKVTAHRVPAEVIAVRNDKEADIALLKVTYDFGEEYLSTVGEDPIAGESLVAHGFTSDTGYQLNRVKLTATSDPSWYSGYVEPGYSGGAVTANQQVRAIVSARTTHPERDGRRTVVTPMSVCLPFLHRHCPCFSSRRVQPKQEVRVITQDTTQLENSVSVLLSRIDSLEKKIDSLSRVPGPQGPRGPQGLAGVDGRDGKDGVNGRDATVDESKLVEAIMKRLPPIPASFSIQPLN